MPGPRFFNIPCLVLVFLICHVYGGDRGAVGVFFGLSFLFFHQDLVTYCSRLS